MSLLRSFAVFLQSGLDIILPRTERTRRIDHYASEDIPVTPHEHEVCGVRIVTLMSYREQIVEDLVRAVKYDRSIHGARLCADTLAEYLREEIASMRAFSTRPIVLVPLPLHSKREAERGFNQMTLILEQLPQEFKDDTLSRVCGNALVRTRETAQQTKLPRHARLENVSDAFALRDFEGLRGAHVMVIDDVTTTGSTLIEATKPFRDAEIPVTALALAHA